MSFALTVTSKHIMLSVFILSAVMLNAVIFANCRFAERRYTKLLYAERRYAECRYAEYSGALIGPAEAAQSLNSLILDVGIRRNLRIFVIN